MSEKVQTTSGSATEDAAQKDEKQVKLIVFEDGLIKLGDTELPGILTELRVDGKVRSDEQKKDGASGKKKTPKGFDDADVMASMLLLTDSESQCYEKLEQVSGLFRKIDKKANPQVYTVTNRHLLARGVRQVVFSKLQSAESNGDDEIRVTLGFVEHNPLTTKIEKAQAKTPTPKELKEQAAEKAKKNSPEADSLIIDVAGKQA